MADTVRPRVRAVPGVVCGELEGARVRPNGVWLNWWCRGRRAALLGAGFWCVVLGIGVAGSLVSHGSLGRAGTFTLMGAVGMLVLPGLTFLALRLDRRERARMLDARVASGGPDRVAHPAHGPESARRDPPAHRVRGRSGERVA